MQREMLRKERAKAKSPQKTAPPHKTKPSRTTAGKSRQAFPIRYTAGNNATRSRAGGRDTMLQACLRPNRNYPARENDPATTTKNLCLERLWLWQAIEGSMNPYGGGQGRTFHSKQTTVPSTQTSGKLNGMYLSIPEQSGVAAPRPYAEEEDIHRFLRWFSTYLSVKHGVHGEVQCYLDKTSHCIIPATNLQREARKLDSPAFEPSADGLDDRQKRHLIHIGRLFEASKQLLEQEVRPNLLIPQNNPEISGPPVDNMHAEQRILAYYNQLEPALQQQRINEGVLIRDLHNNLKLSPNYLGGLRRPCLLCSYAVFGSEGRDRIHSGPVWFTKSASEHMNFEDMNDLINDLHNGKVRTYVSGMLNEGQIDKATYDRDTDSDPESELEPSLTAATQYDAIEQLEDWSTPDWDPGTNRTVYDRMAEKLRDLGIFTPV